MSTPTAPSVSNTRSRAVYGPPAGYVWLAVTVVVSTTPSSVKSHSKRSRPWSAGSASVEEAAEKFTVKGALPDVGAATIVATGG